MATWTLDPAHTSAEFAARHMMVSTVRGRFKTISGTLDFDPENPEASSVEATIQAADLETGVEDRDNHLRSADFLDVDTYPEITFKSTKVDVTGENSGKITGDLTIRGTTREVTLDVEYFGQGQDPYGRTIAGFAASSKINREDFGLTWNVALETGGWLVGKDIKVELNVEAVRETEDETATA